MTGLIFLIGLLLCANTQASNANPSYKEGEHFASVHQQQSIDLLKSLNVHEFPGFQENVPQTQYYGGVTQKRTRMESDSQLAMTNTEVGKEVLDGFNQRPSYRINPNTESMQKLNHIAEQGDAIMRGENTARTTCTLAPQQCQYTWQEKTCLSTKETEVLHCAKHLRLEVMPYKTEDYTLYLQHRQKKRIPYQIVMDLNQSDTCKLGLSPCYTLYQGTQVVSSVVFPEHCVSIKISFADKMGMVLVQKTASCNDKTLFLLIGQCIAGHCNVPYAYSVFMTVESLQSKEDWDNQCQQLEQRATDGLCHLTEPLTCVEPNQTHLINEMPFTRACWKERAAYVCGGQGENTCDLIPLEGCEQSASDCVKEHKGQCITFQQTYQCPLNQCTGNELICGNDAFCLEGDCASHAYEPADENEFKKAMSALSAVADASKTFDEKANYLFKGEKMECSDVMLGLANCCRDKGWGIDLNLAHCTDKEKKLGKDRENKVVVPTGKYCYKREKVPGGSFCKEYRKTFCVFQSKLARIVQEQGRRDQLHIGFNQGKHSNCSGITPEQMQLINFENIDFSEFYQDIKDKMKAPDYQQTANGISERLKGYYSQGDING